MSFVVYPIVQILIFRPVNSTTSSIGKAATLYFMRTSTDTVLVLVAVDRRFFITIVYTT